MAELTKLAGSAAAKMIKVKVAPDRYNAAAATLA